MIGNIHILGIVNVTPDSFYAGSRVQGEAAIRRIEKLFEEGADAIDLGACSTRPGSPQPSLEEEWNRLYPTLKEIGRHALSGACPPPDKGRGRGPLDTSPSRGRQDDKLAWRLSDARRTQETMGGAGAKRSGAESPEGACLPISVDTYRAEIVERVYNTIGPFIVNDISAGGLDAKMLETVGRLGLPYIAMHMRGTPENMQQLTDYPGNDITAAVIAYFKDFSKKAEEYGIKEWIVDPGFGFSKTLEQNYDLLYHLDEVVRAFPQQETLVGVSRKSMIYKKLGITPEEAMPATQVIQFASLEKGATWLRVHDVKEAVQTATLYSTMYMSSPGAAK